MSTEDQETLTEKIKLAIVEITAQPITKRPPRYKYLNAYSRLLRDLNNKEITRLRQEVAQLKSNK